MEDLSQRQTMHVQALVAAGRDAIEAEINPERARANRLRREILRACGAVAIGILAAGVAVFLTAIILNFLFHFSPS